MSRTLRNLSRRHLQFAYVDSYFADDPDAPNSRHWTRCHWLRSFVEEGWTNQEVYAWLLNEFYADGCLTWKTRRRARKACNKRTRQRIKHAEHYSELTRRIHCVSHW